jgi:starch synthase
MAAGVAVIATAIPGTDEAVVHGQTGLLVPPRDPGALAAAVQSLLDDPSRRAQLAAAGAARARQEFSADMMVERITRTYEELLGGNGGGHARI